MKNVKLLFIVSFFILCQTVNAQRNADQIVRVGFRYYHQNEIYDKHDIGYLVEKDSVAYEFYQRTYGIRRKGKIFGITALSLLGSGIGSIIIADNSDRCAVFRRRTCVGYIYGTLAIFGGLLSSGISLAMFSDATIKRNRTVRIFNDNVKTKKRFGEVPIRLDLKVDATKVGLVLNF